MRFIAEKVGKSQGPYCPFLKKTFNKISGGQFLLINYLKYVKFKVQSNVIGLMSNCLIHMYRIEISHDHIDLSAT
jgi:hypothetical protein